MATIRLQPEPGNRGWPDGAVAPGHVFVTDRPGDSVLVCPCPNPFAYEMRSLATGEVVPIKRRTSGSARDWAITLDAAGFRPLSPTEQLILTTG